MGLLKGALFTMKNWVKIQNQLINLNEYKSIDEPTYNGKANSPGTWMIPFCDKNNLVGTWYFNTEEDARRVHKEICDTLVYRFKFLE